MTAMTKTRCIITISLAVLAAACNSLTFPDGDPAIQGEIVGVGPDTPFNGQNTIWVKETPESPCGIVFTVTESTNIGAELPDGSISEHSFADLAVGLVVRVWASGGIAESCPGQGRADAIELIPRWRSDLGINRADVARGMRD
jgi:hypothetical protein